MEQIERAEAAIGEHQSNDWQIQPAGFPERLAADASELAGFLQDSSFTEKAKRFESADAHAVDFQARFKRRATHTSIAIFVGAAATAFLSVIPTAEAWMFGADKYASLIAGIVVFVASGVAIFNTQLISQLKLYDQWMENRARAETARLSYFKQAAQNLISAQPENRPLLLEYCCFFRRYQLQVQQEYYSGRSQQHNDSLRTTAKISAFAAVIVAAFSGSSGLAGYFDQELISFAALGTIGVALTALASRLESINQDERNAARYKVTADVLSRVAEKYSEVQKALAAGKDPAVLLQFVDAVHEQLSLEHRQWTEDAAEINTAFSELSESVKE